MKPRCKPGDMAFIVSGRNAGKIVHIVRAYRTGEIVSGVQWGSDGIPGIAWIIKSAGSLLKNTYTDGTQALDTQTAVLVDRGLNPIRPGKGTDEVLRITGKPKTRTDKPLSI